jgi:mono/diheme cytochrome c family protein
VHSSQSTKNLRALGVVAVFLVPTLAVIVVLYGANNWSAAARARKLKNPVPTTPASIAVGKQIYGQHCLRCHGENGDGRGEKASELAVAPADFTDEHKMSRLTDGELYFEITTGHNPMPSFESKLTDEQRWQAVDYIRTFAPGAAPQQ